MPNEAEFVALLRRMARSHLGTASAAFDQAADTIERLEAEGFALSAGVCPHLRGNEHGNAYCGKTNELI